MNSFLNIFLISDSSAHYICSFIVVVHNVNRQTCAVLFLYDFLSLFLRSFLCICLKRRVGGGASQTTMAQERVQVAARSVHFQLTQTERMPPSNLYTLYSKATRIVGMLARLFRLCSCCLFAGRLTFYPPPPFPLETFFSVPSICRHFHFVC